MSNQDYNIRKVLDEFKNKVSFNQDAFVRVELSNKMNLVNPDKEIFVLNAIDQFNLERNTSNCYRINGKLEILTSNVLSGSYNCNAPTSNDWSPEVIDNTFLNKNWVLQVTYPSEKDTDRLMVSETKVGTKSSRAEEGIQLDSITPINVTGRREQVLLRTVQRHGVTIIGEYVYITPNNTGFGYLGFHRVIDFEAGNEEYGLILETPYNGDATDGTVIRVFEPSLEDVNFSKNFAIDQVEAVDENGQTIGPLNHVKIYHDSHDLRVGDYVDIRFTVGASSLNGVNKIVNITSPNEFIVKKQIPIVVPGPVSTIGVLNYRAIDGTPSEYYLRKFKVITELKDYEVYKAAYSKNIFSDGVSDDVFLFHFDEDIDVSNLRDNLNRPLSELYLTVTKRSSSGAPGYDGYNLWSDVVSIMEENSGVLGLIGNSPYILETLSYWQNTTSDTSGTITKPNSGDTYYGDFVEYNSAFLEEKTLSRVVNRFSIGRDINGTWDGGAGEGYYYLQHNKIQIRKFSDIIETTVNKSNEIFPDYSQINNDGTVSWRDLLSIGQFESGTNGVEYPFVNGCNYLYGNYPIYIRRQIPPEVVDIQVNEAEFVQINPNQLTSKGLDETC